MFHILVVDDDKHTRQLLRAILENEHYTVSTASDGMEALELMDSEHIDLVVLAGYLSILTRTFVEAYPDRIINVHPALIPSFCGKGFYGLRVHEAALEKGVKVTGATVHLVNEIPDGGRILLQKAVDVHDGDTPEVLQKRVMEEAEWKLLPEAVRMMCDLLEKEEER